MSTTPPNLLRRPSTDSDDALSMLAVRIPTEMHTELRILAARARRSIRDIIMDLLRRELTAASRRAAR